VDEEEKALLAEAYREMVRQTREYRDTIEFERDKARAWKEVLGTTQTPQKEELQSSERFKPLDENYQVVELDGRTYNLTPYESKILRLLHKAYLDKRGDVGIGEIQATLEIKSGKMSDWFRKKKFLKKIILHTGRQHYRLNL
jgi:hypothetical protein